MVQLYYGRISDADSTRMSTFFYDLPTTSPRRNAYIYPSAAQATPAKKRGRDGNNNEKGGELRIVNMMDLLDKSGYPYSAGAFVYPRECFGSVLDVW